MKQWAVYGVASALCVAAATPGAAQTASNAGQANNGGGRIDFQNAKPMRMPQLNATRPMQAPVGQQAAPSVGASGFSPGSMGDGKVSPMQLAPAKNLDAPQNNGGAAPSGGQVAPQAYGTSNTPFTTARVNLTVPTGQLATVQSYPYRAAGKLFFNIGASTYVCSAALIKRGLVVTAAHCVTDFGSGGRYFTNFQFVPAYNNGVAPFGVWNAAQVRVLASYLNGTDSCSASGVVCQNDVAVIALTAKATAPAYPGVSTGWFGYVYGNTGFNGSGQTFVTQLGYPVALDNGVLMERTDSQGFRSAANSNNTIIGSLQTGGSSGGPWVLNLGVAPVLSQGVTFPAGSTPNMIAGVTSWGYVNQAIKQQGASPFLSTNIQALVTAQCQATPAACQ